MKVKEVIINEIDLIKLCKLKGITIRHLAYLANNGDKVEAEKLYFRLNRAVNGKCCLQLEDWERIVKFL